MEIFTLKEVAALLRMSENQVWLLTKLPEKEKPIPHFQRGKNCRCYFDKKRVLRWWEDFHTPKSVEVKNERIRLI
ncbi:MAG: helix-turn-helix domain-containing protein [Candidatus Aminicenantes bacterium]|nr:helix-turn-helix domain-containing protein [Candidatus Aminicenantes bacterium]